MTKRTSFVSSYSRQTFRGRDIKFVSLYLAASQTSDGCQHRQLCRIFSALTYIYVAQVQPLEYGAMAREHAHTTCIVIECMLRKYFLSPLAAAFATHMGAYKSRSRMCRYIYACAVHAIMWNMWLGLATQIYTPPRNARAAIYRALWLAGMRAACSHLIIL